MASGASYRFEGSVLGTGAEINVETCPFRPTAIDLYVENAGATDTVIGRKTAEMSGDDYLCTTDGMDDGVTINADGFTISAAATLNVNAKTIYFVCWA